MRTAAFCIHMGLSYNSVAFSSLHKFQTLMRVLDNYLIQSLYIDSILFVLVYLQFLFFRCLGVIFEEIGHVLVVDLQKGTVDFEVLASPGDKSVKQSVHTPKNDPSVVLVLFYTPQER